MPTRSPGRQLAEPGTPFVRPSYRALGQPFVEDSAQRERLAARHPDLPRFQRAAIAAFAESRL